MFSTGSIPLHRTAGTQATSTLISCCYYKQFKRETSRTDLSDNALLPKGTDITAPCMSEIISTCNICKSCATSNRLGKMENQAHTTGHMNECRRSSPLHRREQAAGAYRRGLVLVCIGFSFFSPLKKTHSTKAFSFLGQNDRKRSN